MGLLGQRDAPLRGFVRRTLRMGNIASLCNMVHERGAEPLCQIEMRRDVTQTVGASALLAASGTLPMTMDAFRLFVSRIERTACCSSMACSTEMAEARIDIPMKPADAASGASAPIGRTDVFRVDDLQSGRKREATT